jgi:perosamine synthetase
MLKAQGVGGGDEVIVPAFTFPATASAVALLGATPVLADVEPSTWNLDTTQASALRTPRTRVLLPVDQLGLTADVDAIADAASGVPVLVDAACSLGASDRSSRPAGSLGRMACISFHPRKTITTGEGGAVVCDDDALAHRLRQLRNHGIDGADVLEPSLNFRLTDFQAALALSQLDRLDDLVAARRAIAARYSERLARLTGSAVGRFQEPRGARHSYQTIGFILGESQPHGTDAPRSTAARDHLRAAMAERGVELGLAGWGLHRTRAYAAPAARFPVADELAARGVALPCWPGMPLEAADRVSDALVSLLEKTS